MCLDVTSLQAEVADKAAALLQLGAYLDEHSEQEENVDNLVDRSTSEADVAFEATGSCNRGDLKRQIAVLEQQVRQKSTQGCCEWKVSTWTFIRFDATPRP